MTIQCFIICYWDFSGNIRVELRQVLLHNVCPGHTLHAAVLVRKLLDQFPQNSLKHFNWANIDAREGFQKNIENQFPF